MRSRGQIIFINSGQTVKFDCEFDAYGLNLFDNPVVWTKVQRSENTQINVMSNIIEPFLSTQRLSVSMFINSLSTLKH